MTETKKEYIQKKLIEIHSAVEIDKKFNLQDVNIRAEEIFRRVLNATYSWNLIDANKKIKNFPAIDLIDESEGIVIQITSSLGTIKINETVKGFKKFKDDTELKKYAKYRLIFCYIIKEKEVRTDKYLRDRNLKNDDFIDITDILKKIDEKTENSVYEVLKSIYVEDMSGGTFNQTINNITIIYSSDNEKKETQKELSSLKIDNSSFVLNLIERLENEKVMVLFSQEFTNIEGYYLAIKQNLKTKFGTNFYRVSIPSFKKEKKYFASIAKSCGIKDKIKELQDWKDAMEKKLKNFDDNVILFVTDLEDGNEKYNRKFATTIRNLHYDYPHLFVLFIGRKKLASLVFQQGELSPLRSVGGREFFPSENVIIKEEDIVFEFQVSQKQKKYFCELLNTEQISRFSEWSADNIINQLFWRNLLVRDGKYLVWGNEEIKKIGREVVGC